MRLVYQFANLVLILVLAAFFSMAAFAQADIGGFPIPEGDINKLLLELATNYKALGFVGVSSLVVLLAVQVIKKFVSEDWKYKRLLTLSVSIIYSIIAGFVVPGSNAVTIIVTVFVSSGGAVALYEALKGAGVIKKKVPGLI